METVEIERKWRERWEKARIYEAEVDKKREKRFVTAAFPYPNSPQHIGHGRTYTTADIFARYLRLKGYNVLFPMAFHVTGTPIIAMARRIEKNDPELFSIFENVYGIDRKTIRSLKKPVDLVMYFSREIEEGMREMGYSIDWRRKFYSSDKKFNKFIQWQFRKLREGGHLVQGSYPIAWCPAEKQAIGAHDTQGDIDPEVEKVTAILFPFEDGSLIVTTYRPETIYGVTNIWINKDAVHVCATKDGKKLYLTKSAAESLRLQLNLKIEKEMKGDYFIGKEAVNPVTGNTIPIFPAMFVNEEEGTGVVMSVPAHAPYDYLALRDLGKKDIEMPQVIKLKGFGKNPAAEIVERLGVKDQNDPLAEKATKELYRMEAHEGVMAVSIHAGTPVKDAKEAIAEDIVNSGNGWDIYVIANAPVYCRCGTRAVVNILQDQWFIDYGSAEWKERAKKCLSQMKIIPEKSRHEYLYAIDWFKQRPCTRASGLGTHFPFDEKIMIEALSDSTIYMAFYTFAHLLERIDEKEIDDGFFDYVLLGKGKEKAGWKELRESFLYWYPVDVRHSAIDLIRNHLPFFIFNHTAIFPENLWPKGIVTNGFVLMEGKKMSKSMGNILPIRKTIAKYGADIVRFSVVAGADLTQDTDFNTTVAEGIKWRLEFIKKLIDESMNGDEKTGQMGRWLLSRLNRKIKRADSLYEQIAIRELSLDLFYDVVNDLQWYKKRTEQTVPKEFFIKWVQLIAPFMPYHAEEFWEMLGEKPFVALSEFPRAVEELIDYELEHGEELVKAVRSDLEQIVKLVGKKPEKAFIYVASEWKRTLYNIVAKEKKFDAVMRASSSYPELKGRMGDVQRIAKRLVKEAYSLQKILSEKGERDTLDDAKAFFEREFSCSVFVLPEEGAKHEKAGNALPGKPAIVLE